MSTKATATLWKRALFVSLALLCLFLLYFNVSKSLTHFERNNDRDDFDRDSAQDSFRNTCNNPHTSADRLFTEMGGSECSRADMSLYLLQHRSSHKGAAEGSGNWFLERSRNLLARLTSTSEAKELDSAARRGIPPKKTWFYKGGVKTWKDATQCPESYQWHDEKQLLSELAHTIAVRIVTKATIFDFGAGGTNKIEPLLRVLDQQSKEITLVLVDIDQESLDNEVKRLRDLNLNVTIRALCMTFEEGIESFQQVRGQRVAGFLGSTIHLDSEPGPTKIMHQLSLSLRPGDLLYAGQDCHDQKHAARILANYNTPHIRRLIAHGLKEIKEAVRPLGSVSDEYTSGLGVTPNGTLYHEFATTYSPRGEKDIKWSIFRSYKSTPKRMTSIFAAYGLQSQIYNIEGSYLFLVDRPPPLFRGHEE